MGTLEHGIESNVTLNLKNNVFLKGNFLFIFGTVDDPLSDASVTSSLEVKANILETLLTRGVFLLSHDPCQKENIVFL